MRALRITVSAPDGDDSEGFGERQADGFTGGAIAFAEAFGEGGGVGGLTSVGEAGGHFQIEDGRDIDVRIGDSTGEEPDRADLMRR